MKVVGALLGTMSGSMGGLTASRNRGGQYFRQRVIPTNPSSTRQNAVRSYLAAAVSAWTNTLTAAQRGSWTTYAANTPRTTPLGTEVVLTGQQAYIGAYVPRMQGGLTVPADGPTTFNRGEPVVSIVTQTNDLPNTLGLNMGLMSNEINLGDAASDDGDLLIYIGPPVGPGVNYWKGPYQLASVVGIAPAASQISWDVDIVTLTDEYALVVGQRRPVRIVAAYDDGRTTDAFRVICDVVDDT